jgi:hypothetical protein
MTTILFLHGWHSVPGGVKPTYLKDHGHGVINPNRTTSTKEASYVCDARGEEINIPLDLTERSSQTYVEDCPVCCRANTIHVEIDDDADARVWPEAEQD